MTKRSRGFISLFNLCFLIPGLTIFSIGLWLAIVQHYRLTTYLPIPAHIISSAVESSKNSDGTTYKPNIHYSYQVQGHQYQSDQVRVVGSYYQSGSWPSQICAQHPKGSDTTAWYSPQNPTRSFLVHEPDFLAYILVPFGIPFVLVGGGVQSLKRRHQNQNLRPPTPSGNGWYDLYPEKTVRLKFKTYLTGTLLWYGLNALLIGDYLMLNQYQFTTPITIIAGITATLGLIGAIPCWLNWRLCHDYADPQVCANLQEFTLGDTVQLYVNQPLQKPLQVKLLTIGALCQSTTKVTANGETSISTSQDQSIWQEIPILNDDPTQNVLTGTCEITLPPTAHASTPITATDFPFYRWFIVLKIEAQGQPKLQMRFPIMVNPGQTV